MVIDSSALVAILLKEPGWERLARAIEAAEVRFVASATLLETAIVIEARKGPQGGDDLDLFIFRTGTEIVPIDSAQIEAARIGWRRFGKGNHGAALNLGDLFAYALAKGTGLPLLFKGGDFAKTDIVPALPSR